MATFVETQPTETQEQANVTESPCVKCGMATTLAAGAVTRGHGLQCRSCNNVYQIVYRHLGGLPPSFQSMTAEQQRDFFRSTGGNVTSTPKNGRWSLVRKNMVTSMVNFKKQQTTTSVKKTFKPLSAWQVKGYDPKEIEAKGESKDDDVFGKVWTAPLLTIKIDDIVGSVEKELAEKEMTLKHVKGKKRAKGVTKPSDAQASVTVDGSDDDVWSIPSEDENVAKASGRGSSKAAKSTEKDAAAAARKEQRQREQAWKKEVAKAAKCIQSLNSTCSSLAFLLNKTEKNPGSVQLGVVTGMKEANEKLMGMKTRATALISAGDDMRQSRDPEIFTEVAEVTDAVTAAKAVMKDARTAFSEVAQQKKAARGPVPPKASRAAAGKAKAKAKAA